MSYFADLRRTDPGLANELIAACGGDVANAAELFDAIAGPGYNSGYQLGAEAEHLRCREHVDLAVLAGDLTLALPGVESGEPAAKWAGYYLECAGRARELVRDDFGTLGRPLAVALVNAALAKGSTNAN